MTTRVVGAALLAAAGYVPARSVHELIKGVGPKHSALGVGISAVSLLVLPPLAAVKFRLARRLPSPALRSDGVLIVGAALLAGVALIAAFLRSVEGLWWNDPAAALVIAAVLAVEGMQAARAPGA